MFPYVIFATILSSRRLVPQMKSFFATLLFAAVAFLPAHVDSHMTFAPNTGSLRAARAAVTVGMRRSWRCAELT